MISFLLFCSPHPAIYERAESPHKLYRGDSPWMERGVEVSCSIEEKGDDHVFRFNRRCYTKSVQYADDSDV